MPEPLAARMRPRSLDEVVGQQHLIGPGRLLRRMIETDTVRNLILFGPPGTGKTSLVHALMHMTKRPFVSLNAISAGVKEIREALAQLDAAGGGYLHIDEVHRLNRGQCETLLQVESGQTVFIGTTTEIPHLEVPPALRSRCTIMELRPLEPADVIKAIRLALTDSERGLGGLKPVMDDNVITDLAAATSGDLRAALTALEVAVTTAPVTADGQRIVTKVWLRECLVEGMQHSFGTSDEYDCLSGLQKSIRGSDPDAALHYAARLVAQKFDLPTLLRRLAVICSEDIGNAYPGLIGTVMACCQAALMVGYPEAQHAIAQAVTLMAVSPKSNAAYLGMHRALADVQAGKGQSVPMHLRDAHYKGAKSLGRNGYLYPHDYPGAVVVQQYLPDDLLGATYYQPTDHGQEKQFKERLQWLREMRSRK